MCRWIAYSGGPIYLDELLFKPKHSLIDQSLSAKHGVTTTNGDGFGVGWYGTGDVPGLYKGTQPAWGDENLVGLASQVKTPMFMAHIRAATGTPVQRSNCHPFRHGRWLFQHNGEIHGFRQLKRDLMVAIEPELFPQISGSTDSEVLFFLALTFGLQDDPIRAVERMIRFVEDVGREHGVANALQMTLAIMDGRTLYAFRYASAGKAHTLFHSASIATLRRQFPAVGMFTDEARAVVSEPLGPPESIREVWVEIPQSSAVIVAAGNLEVVPLHARAAA
jgi:predicted glutamine amidotransferase